MRIAFSESKDTPFFLNNFSFYLPNIARGDTLFRAFPAQTSNP